MKVKITGFYTLPSGENVEVGFDELFDTSFMRKYTRYRSFEKFLAGGRFAIEGQADFEALDEAAMDAHVRRSTGFKSWKEMLDHATDLHVRRRG